eukprot:UN23538
MLARKSYVIVSLGIFDVFSKVRTRVNCNSKFQHRWKFRQVQKYGFFENEIMCTLTVNSCMLQRKEYRSEESFDIRISFVLLTF